MAESVPNGDHHTAVPCARCHIVEATIVIRTEKLCKECLCKYVTTKVYKRMETNKLRGGYGEPEKKLLVPISFGVSSISLLQLLDAQIHGRLEQGRHAGYTLHLLHIDHSSVSSQSVHPAKIESLKQRFPSYPFSTILIEECFDYGITIDTAPNDASPSLVEDTMHDARRRLDQMLSAAKSPTSKKDLVDIIWRRLIAAFARRHACDSILYGDSTTRLAERTLAETAKGRGAYLPQLTTDGMTVDGVYCSYPLRDLLKKELCIYSDISRPPLTHLIVEDDIKALVASSKDNTIDSLMHQYFESVENDYPSIVANVVRTTSKLRPQSASEGAKICRVCQQPISTGIWGGEQEDGSCAGMIVPELTPTLCYGCTRTLQTR